MTDLNTDKISFIGLGKLGLCMAMCFAVKGKYDVIGIDINENVVNSLNKGISPIVEPRLQEFINEAGKKFRATLNNEEAITKTDITFVMTATPSLPDGSFSSQQVENVLTDLAKTLKKSPKKYHLFVLSSTVMPGSINEKFIPLLEKHSGRKLNEGFGFCYSPDLVALGSVIHDYLNPDMVILGQSSEFAGEQVAAIHHRTCENNPPVFQMSLINAEIAKVTVNTYITTKISFANALSNICERIPGADIDVITRAVGADKRISPYYFKGGLSYGGACFPRDTVAYRAMAKKYGYKDVLIASIDEVNKYQDQHLADITLDAVRASGDNKVSILGLAFKTDTPVIQESSGIKLVQAMVDKGVEVIGYDALATENAKSVFGEKIKYTKSVKECIASSSVCVLTITAKEFKQIDDSFIKFEPTTIIDCWRLLDPSRFTKKVNYIPWGRGYSVQK